LHGFCALVEGGLTLPRKRDYEAGQSAGRRRCIAAATPHEQRVHRAPANRSLFHSVFETDSKQCGSRPRVLAHRHKARQITPAHARVCISSTSENVWYARGRYNAFLKTRAGVAVFWRSGDEMGSEGGTKRGLGILKTRTLTPGARRSATEGAGAAPLARGCDGRSKGNRCAWDRGAAERANHQSSARRCAARASRVCACGGAFALPSCVTHVRLRAY